LENFEYTLDILLNERLYCADFESLNDPMEGMYISIGNIRLPFSSVGQKTEKLRSIKDMFEYERFSRVCSLSLAFDDVRMWSYYANDHKGIAIELDFTGFEGDLSSIVYKDSLKTSHNTIIDSSMSDQIMKQKTEHWLHEKEFRVLQSEPYYSVKNRISGVYLGSRISEIHCDLLNKVLDKKCSIQCTKMNAQTLKVEIA
jgi:hypothetical protein